MTRKPAGQPDPSRERAVDATAWFSVLVNARRRDHFDEAAQAQRELERLGVTVKFRRRVREAQPA